MTRVLITGGAGFIGSHLADLLLDRGYRVRVLDSLVPQVHGEGQARPAYLDPEVELIRGDVRNPVPVRRALEGVDSVVHLAAAVGVGQSMYQIADYVGINDLGTAVLLETLASHPVQRLVVASSMSIYGEGLARTADGRTVEPEERPVERLKRGQWEPRALDDATLAPLPTPETKRPALSSVYALNKYTQERLCLVVGRAYGIPTTALRFFNVYGARQALSNPYTGVLAIFAARLLNGRPPLIFEDGQQRRDFVHVRDVARAILAALTRPEAADQAINVGSGVSRTVEEVARALARAVGRPDLQPQITGRYRAGDIRHCFADIGLARKVLGFTPQEDFDAGLEELAEWLAGEVAVDRVDQATEELARRGLVA
ncbi:NAD-dependent epimerase/dehydratase family protein [Benzoatithermus flavus]|uniref:NAD-dependent epimerase/dehydratase family protein n=1 Tax=Benzoatithermus flavus TaxID=3108223 RepID=A0ABU8XVU7_9PROT